MKKIGLVGGTGPESTAMYYKELNTRIDRLTGGAAMPEIAIESVDFHLALRLVSEHRHEELASYIADKVSLLANAGADVIALTAVTMHLVVDEVEAQSHVELVRIPAAVRDEAIAKGYKRVGLLGTIPTMEQDYMKKDLTDAGIEVVVPEKDDRLLVAKHIFEELEFGIVRESTLAEFNEIIGRMRDSSGIEAVILGCTELPLLLNSENCVLPCLDSVDIHINKLIGLCMQAN